MKVQEINREELLEFIAKAHRNTYAAPGEIRQKHRCKVPILSGHKDYEFVDGLWRYHDSYAGRILAPGSEVVFFKDVPVWRMSYQSMPDESLSPSYYQNCVFPFLRRALTAFKDDCPFRGLNGFTEPEYSFQYNFQIRGDYKYFTGQEIIEDCGREVFFQDVMGH
ncbi:MAG: DUF5680 domain-containing protein [Nanoarchaeota archaeon]